MAIKRFPYRCNSCGIVMTLAAMVVKGSRTYCMKCDVTHTK